MKRFILKYYTHTSKKEIMLISAAIFMFCLFLWKQQWVIVHSGRINTFHISHVEKDIHF